MKNVIVLGMPRCGLTMTMQMLNRGGYPCYGEWPAFEVQKIDWDKTKGQAVKVIDKYNFPPPHVKDLSVILCSRDAEQQTLSQAKLLRVLCNIPVGRADIRKMEKEHPRSQHTLLTWARKQKEMITYRFEDTLKDPAATAQQLNVFLDFELDHRKAAAAVISRDSECYPGFLETAFV